MVRLQIRLTEVQHRRLKRWAGRLGISLAEAVRRCISDRLGAERPEGERADLIREAWSVVGKYVDPQGQTRIGPDHDDDLSKAFRK